MQTEDKDEPTEDKLETEESGDEGFESREDECPVCDFEPPASADCSYIKC